MRENRTHGSEGGEDGSPSLPLSSCLVNPCPIKKLTTHDDGLPRYARNDEEKKLAITRKGLAMTGPLSGGKSLGFIQRKGYFFIPTALEQLLF